MRITIRPQTNRSAVQKARRAVLVDQVLEIESVRGAMVALDHQRPHAGFRELFPQRSSESMDVFIDVYRLTRARQRNRRASCECNVSHRPCTVVSFDDDGSSLWQEFLDSSTKGPRCLSNSTVCERHTGTGCEL